MAYEPPLPELTEEEELDCENEARQTGTPLWVPRIIKRQDKEIERLREENAKMKPVVEAVAYWGRAPVPYIHVMQARDLVGGR